MYLEWPDASTTSEYDGDNDDYVYENDDYLDDDNENDNDNDIDNDTSTLYLEWPDASATTGSASPKSPKVIVITMSGYL